ncbi:MAG: HAMP domain-containing sensor histidine kinase [Bacteroidales bacterium]
MGDFEEKDDIIMHTGKQMMTLVMNMLDIQKFENNRMELNLVYIPVSKVLETASKDVSFSAKHKNITITHTFGDDFILYIDKELIIRTLVNLLSNSIKFSPSSSPVTINVMKESKDRVMIEVTDQGVGIDKANQDLIFEKFVHIKQNSSGTMRSTGLGLTFCKMAVEAHKCHIGVISEKDKGATFWFTLPLGLNK